MECVKLVSLCSKESKKSTDEGKECSLESG